MKRKVLSTVLALTLVMAGFGSAYAGINQNQEGIPVNDGKKVIFERIDTVDYLTSSKSKEKSSAVSMAGIFGSGATFEHDGSVHYDQGSNTYYMQGWSTCKNSNGTDLNHYTIADFANGIFSQNSFGASKEWGTGKVWATSDSVGWEVYDSTYGRIRYGL